MKKSETKQQIITEKCGHGLVTQTAKQKTVKQCKWKVPFRPRTTRNVKHSLQQTKICKQNVFSHQEWNEKAKYHRVIDSFLIKILPDKITRAMLSIFILQLYSHSNCMTHELKFLFIFILNCWDLFLNLQPISYKQTPLGFNYAHMVECFIHEYCAPCCTAVYFKCSKADTYDQITCFKKQLTLGRCHCLVWRDL